MRGGRAGSCRGDRRRRDQGQANASHHATRDYEQIAREILEHADAVDAEEDERFGDARGDELPEVLSTPEGRQRWLRDARRRVDERRAREARPIPGPRPKRLKEAKRRLEEDHQVQLDANAAYLVYVLPDIEAGRLTPENAGDIGELPSRST